MGALRTLASLPQPDDEPVCAAAPVPEPPCPPAGAGSSGVCIISGQAASKYRRRISVTCRVRTHHVEEKEGLVGLVLARSYRAMSHRVHQVLTQVSILLQSHDNFESRDRLKSPTPGACAREMTNGHLPSAS